MGDLIKPDFTVNQTRILSHKGWSPRSSSQDYLGADGQDGERRLAARALELKAHEAGDAAAAKLIKHIEREELRKSLRVIQSDIDRSR